MFDDPKGFAEFIDGKACICLTATPDNEDAEGVEVNVSQTIGFSRYQANQNMSETKVQIDEVLPAESIE